MPQEHTCSFKIRHYECDVYGHVNNSVYLRYLAETALDASGSAGFPIPEMPNRGVSWWLKRFHIEYLQPLFFGETVHVTVSTTGTAVNELHQAYRFQKADSQEMAAQCQAVQILVHRDTGEPAHLPLAHTSVLPSQPEVGLPHTEPYTLPAEPPPGAFSVTIPVTWRDVDAYGRLDASALLVFLQECGGKVLDAHGWPVARMIATRHAIFLRSHQLEYHEPAVLDDDLIITTWISDVRRAMANRCFSITRLSDGKRLASVQSLGVWVNLDSGRPERFPAQFLEDFSPNIFD